MKYLPTNTLAHFKDAPQTHLHDLSELPTAVFAASSLKYKQGCTTTSPNDDAVSFYTLNHCASIVRQMFTLHEPLPEWARTIMQSYTDACMAQGERMLHYILCITTRETRHLRSCTAAFWSKLEKDLGASSVAVLKHISSDGNEGTAMDKYLKTPPEMSIGQYVKTLSYAFHKAGSTGWSGGYGGKPWGDVTDAAVAMIYGVTSMEMLVDTGYTLAHNGGPIFNKTDVKIYSMYDNHFLTVLDVQRSGQMLDLMFETQTLGIKRTPDALAAAELIKTHCPVDANKKPTLKGYLDWKLVDDLRPEGEKGHAPSKYTKLITAQTQTTAKPKSVKPVVGVPAVEKVITLHGKKAKKKGEFQVYPKQTVTIVVRTGE